MCILYIYIYIYDYVYIYISLYLYIYIYIYRERERERAYYGRRPDVRRPSDEDAAARVPLALGSRHYHFISYAVMNTVVIHA